MLSLYNYVGPEEDPKEVFPVGTIFALLAPYMKNSQDDPEILCSDAIALNVLYYNLTMKSSFGRIQVSFEKSTLGPSDRRAMKLSSLESYRMRIRIILKRSAMRISTAKSLIRIRWLA